MDKLQPIYVVNVSNSLDYLIKAPILIADVYEQQKTRMGSYLRRKGKDVWRSVVDVPYVVPKLPLDDLADALLSGGNSIGGQPRREPRPTTL